MINPFQFQTGGRLLDGAPDALARSAGRFAAQPVDFLWQTEPGDAHSPRMTTLAKPSQPVSGRGTFKGRATRTLAFLPSEKPGWWIRRADLHEQFMVEVSPRNIWTTQRNIVLRSGSPRNYLRMVEHIVALRLGMGVDDVTIRVDSGDPPLFDRSSMDLIETIDKAQIIERDEPATFVTVKEPVTFGGNRGDFLTFLPPENGEKKLRLDCAIDFNSVIGKQRIVFDVTPETFRYGAYARTNATHRQMLLAKTIGIIRADMRNLGYTKQNILIHGRKKFYNEPRFVQKVGANNYSPVQGGKALEPVWHRATLDLLAAIALIDKGRFVGRFVSYRAGHTLDVRAVAQLYLHDLLEVIRER